MRSRGGSKDRGRAFGDLLLERACIKLLKSEGFAYCKIALGKVDRPAITKNYTLEQAANVLAPRDRDPVKTQDEPETTIPEDELQKPQPLDAFLRAAWAKLKLLLGGS